jgi:hypothetical protein
MDWKEKLGERMWERKVSGNGEWVVRGRMRWDWNQLFLDDGGMEEIRIYYHGMSKVGRVLENFNH